MIRVSVNGVYVSKVSEVVRLAGWTYRDVAQAINVAPGYAKALCSGSFPIYDTDVKQIHTALAAAGVTVDLDEFRTLFRSFKEGEVQSRRRRAQKEE